MATTAEFTLGQYIFICVAIFGASVAVAVLG